MSKDLLTNESLKALFKNNFDLANYVMRLARYYVASGREVNIDHLLDEVRKNPKILETLKELDQINE